MIFLKKGIYFHQHPAFGSEKTREVVAADFVFSLNRLSDPQTASPGGWVMQNVKNITAIDDHHLSFQLKKPFPAFLGLLSMRYCSVIPEEVIAEIGSDFRKKPIGTGPFKFKNWEEDVKLIFRKNQQYHEKDTLGNKLPYLEAVAITFVPDKQSEFMLFLQKKIDFLNAIDNAYKDELLTNKGTLQDKYSQKINLQKRALPQYRILRFLSGQPLPRHSI